jgi:hypothetical protein
MRSGWSRAGLPVPRCVTQWNLDRVRRVEQRRSREEAIWFLIG